MTHYKAETLVKGKTEKLTKVSLGGIEYEAKDEHFEVPDGHAAAHKDAETMGLVRGTPEPKKRTKPEDEPETGEEADEGTGTDEHPHGRGRRPRQQ